MKKYHVSSGYIDRTIKTIETNCFLNADCAFSGAELLRFCTKPKNLYALHLLEASGEIRMLKSDASEYPYAVFLENKGLLHSYTKWKKCVSGIKGFIAGLLSGILVTVGSQLLFGFISTLLLR